MKWKRKALLVLLDIFLINLAFIIAIYIRYDDFNVWNYLNVYAPYLMGLTLVKIAVFYFFKMYKSIWIYSSFDELLGIIMAIFLGNILSVAYLLLIGVNISKKASIIAFLLDIVFIAGVRHLYRIFVRFWHVDVKNREKVRVIIIGANASGLLVLSELRRSKPIKYIPIGFIDEDPLKKKRTIDRIPVLGNRLDIIEVCDKYNIDEIIIALPSASLRERQNIIDECSKTKCITKILPGIYDLVDQKISMDRIREVKIIDLLGREEVKLNFSELNNLISSKTILVTGGGGSIGSELCRQIVKSNPKQLIIFDIYENTAYEIQLELLNKNKNLNLVVLIGSIRDKLRVEEIMVKYKPNVIFHAAAHKHVPLMEDSPKEAIKNNVYGTLNMVQAAHKHNVEKFIQISTDKAVNPTNVMGATKRLCEKIIQAHNNISETDFVAVRFGNVLGSNGSVIPIFKRQIAEGGPVTVTDKRISRYFMTITEACQLVLQAGAIATGGEIFILDMGEPIKIETLALHLIKLSGYQPNVDIAVVYTGLRPGEKLYEELLLNKEVARETSHERIYVEPPEYIDYNNLILDLQRMEKDIETKSDIIIKELLKQMDLRYGAVEDII